MLHVEMLTLLFLVLWMCVFSQDPGSKVVADRYAVYWNSSNPSRIEMKPFLSSHTLCGGERQSSWFSIISRLETDLETPAPVHLSFPSCPFSQKLELT